MSTITAPTTERRFSGLAAPSIAAPSTPPLAAAAVIGNAVSFMLEAIVEVERLMASLMASRTVAINELYQLALVAENPDRSGFGRPWSTKIAAHRIASSELAVATRISEREAQQLVADSTTLVEGLPVTLDALRSGRVSYRHASILIDEARSLPAESWAAFEAVALPEAETRTPAGFRQRARIVRERQHPTSIDERRRDAVDGRSVRLEPGRDGMAWLTAHLPAEQAIGAYQRLTEMACGLEAADDPRTLAQRRADVFADLLIDGVASNTGFGRGVRATVLVTVPVLTLLEQDASGSAPAKATATATLEGYGPISDDVARRLAAHAPSFVRLLTHPETGAVLSVGRDRYTVPKDLKLWLRIRDETCRFPGCGRAAANSDIDHTVDWQHDGATRHDNLAHLCRPHHRLKHNSDWRVNHAGGGALEWEAPSGRTYRTEPATHLTG
jgi:hypothetical protein